MLAIRLENPGISKATYWRIGCAVVFLLMGLAPCTAPAASANTSARGPHSVVKNALIQAAAAKKPAAGAQSAPEQTAPKAPDWPVNDKPKEATVVWNSKGLSIEATNSSLHQILNDVATATGAKVSGMTTDQRVFGTFGPGAARDVLSKLLDGSGYNVLMVGDMGQGAPREIVLSKAPTGPAPPVVNSPPSAYEDNSPDTEEPQPPQPLVQPQNAPEGPAPPNQPRTPQQILQEMQRRQQLIEQMQQRQQNNPQNQ